MKTMGKERGDAVKEMKEGQHGWGAMMEMMVIWPERLAGTWLGFADHNKRLGFLTLREPLKVKMKGLTLADMYLFEVSLAFVERTSCRSRKRK